MESQSDAAKLARVQDVRLRAQTWTALTAACGAAKFRPNRRFTVAGDSVPEQLFWRRVRDSNPRYVAVYLISSQAPSTTRPTLRGNAIV